MDDLVLRSRPEPDTKLAEQIQPFVNQMLGDGFSVIDPGVRIWAADVAEEVRHRIADNPLLGSETQWTKLDQQLSGASDEAVLLAAEMVLLREHPLRSSLPSTRIRHVEGVLAHLTEERRIPDSIQALIQNRPKAGFEGGQGYNGALWRQLIWFAEFIIAWDHLPSSAKEEARANPWSLQEAMLAVENDRTDMRNALQFLVRPDAFEPISSEKMKLDIRKGLMDRIEAQPGTSPDAIDKDLLAIRRSIALEREQPFHFWSPGVIELWDPGSVQTETEDADEPRGTHYWLFAPGRQAEYWDEQRSKGIMALGWDELGDFTQYPDREAIRVQIDKDETGRPFYNDTLAIWEFVQEMEIGDIVYAKRGRSEVIGRGRVTGEAYYDPHRETYRNVRTVDWINVGSWEHPGKKAVTKTLTDITRYQGYVQQMEALFEEEVDSMPSPAEIKRYDKADFLREVYMPSSRYDRLRSLVLRKKNVILAGPPGVGKTYAAKRLAYSIMGEKDASRIRTVQFHQSYSYEDFVAGYRPTETGGFVLEHGPFYEFCETAMSDPDRDYFFIIDEINRGNISKIFGELLMLMEADKRGTTEVRLAYGNELFSIPPNLYIIGMMNTADRSLALLDYALRRRFGFFEMSPAFETAQFKRYLESENSPALESLVNTIIALNATIADDPALGRGFAVGHSYVSSKEATNEDDLWLRSVVEDELIPLIEEYWFDEPSLAAEWSAILRGAVDE